MGRRTLISHKLKFNVTGEPDSYVPPADISGRGLIEIVRNWSESLIGKGPIMVAPQTHIRVERVARFNSNILLIEALSGKSNEPGVLCDVDGAMDDIPIGLRQAPMSGCRALLFCPPCGDMALWFSEYSSRSSAARYLLSYLRQMWPGLETETVYNESRTISSDDLLAGGHVTEVEVRTVRRSEDRSDPLEETSGIYSHVFRPFRKKISASLVQLFRKDPKKAFEMVELDVDPLDDEARKIFVGVEVAGHKRKIDISDPDDGLYYRVELNDYSESVLSDEEIVAFCSEEATAYFERYGQTWEPGWSTGGWGNG